MADQNYQLGVLTAAVEALTRAVEENTKQNKELSQRIGVLENKYRFGRGMFFGALVALGFLAYGAKGMLLKFLGVFL